MYNNESMTHKMTLQRKFQKLSESVGFRQLPGTNIRTVENISSKTLTEHQATLLSHGLNFAPAPRKIQVNDYITTMEPIIQGLAEADRPNTRLQLVTALKCHRPP